MKDNIVGNLWLLQYEFIGQLMEFGFFFVFMNKLFIILFDFVKGILYIKLFDSVYK